MFFASDNSGIIHPQIMQAMVDANTGYAMPYGNDDIMEGVRAQLREIFEAPDAAVYLVATGTAANVLSLGCYTQPWQTIFCAQYSHIEEDECNAPEFYAGGAKLTLIPTDNKMTPEGLSEAIAHRAGGSVHMAQSGAVSITQVTEFGSVHSLDELRALIAVAKSANLPVHLDGARFANAVATLGCHPSEITWRAGVDVLCFGGTKNGLPVGEAVVFFDKHLSEDFAYRVKQAGQLANKMRFISAPWLGMLQDDVWLSNARHANTMAQRLRSKLKILEGLSLLAPTQANGVFVNLPQTAIDKLQTGGWRFYEFIAGGGCRFMCSWDTTDEAVDALVSAIEASLN